MPKRRRASRRTPLHVAFARPWPGTRRGVKLWVLALIIGAKGLGYALGQVPASTESSLRFVVGYLGAPLPLVGWAIVALCVFAAFCSYCHHGRDAYGYMALAGFAFGWAGVFLGGGVLGGSWFSAWQGAVSYLAIAGFVLVCASDPEPVPVKDLAALRPGNEAAS